MLFFNIINNSVAITSFIKYVNLFSKGQQTPFNRLVIIYYRTL